MWSPLASSALCDAASNLLRVYFLGAIRGFDWHGSLRFSTVCFFIWQSSRCHALLTTTESCNQTMWDVLSTFPGLGYVQRMVASPYMVEEYFSSSNISVTVLLPSEDDIQASLIAQLGKDAGAATFDTIMENHSILNTFMLYHLIPGGSYEAGFLASHPYVQNGLGVVLSRDYALNFKVDAATARLTATGLGSRDMNILKCIKSCNGWLHVVSGLLTPMQLVQYPLPTYVPWTEEVGLYKASCTETLYQQLTSLTEDSFQLAAARQVYPDLLTILKQSDMALSVFVFLGGAVMSELAQEGFNPANESHKSEVKSLLLYTMLPTAYCPAELARAISVHTALADVSGHYSLLYFNASSDGRVLVYGGRSQQHVAVIMSIVTVCQSIIYIMNGSFVGSDFTDPTPPSDDAFDSISEQLVASPDAPRMTCEYPLTQSTLAAVWSDVQGAGLQNPAQVPPAPEVESSASGAAGAGLGSTVKGSSAHALEVVVPVCIAAVVVVLLLGIGIVGWRRRSRWRLKWESWRDASRQRLRRNRSGRLSGAKGQAIEPVIWNTEELINAIAQGSGMGPDRRHDKNAMYRRQAKDGSSPQTSVPEKLSSLNELCSDSTPSEASAPLSDLGSFPPNGAKEDDSVQKRVTNTNTDDGASGDESTLQITSSNLSSYVRNSNAWEIDEQELEFCTNPDGSYVKLGQGGCGEVYKGIRSGVQDVAIKVLRSGKDKVAQQQARLQKEIGLLKDCRDRNVVQFYGAVMVDEFNVRLVTEYMPNGDLFHAIRDDVDGELRWYRRGQEIALDVARGLAYLHSRRIVHLDLKSPNILLDAHGTAKLGDMGLSEILGQDPLVVSENGTYVWAAPELLMSMKMTEKADLYSFGVVLWEIVKGRPPARGKLDPPRVPEECPQAIKDLMDACLKLHAWERPSAREAFYRIKQAIEERGGVVDAPNSGHSFSRQSSIRGAINAATKRAAR